MTDQARYDQLSPIARALVDDYDALNLAEMLVKAQDVTERTEATLRDVLGAFTGMRNGDNEGEILYYQAPHILPSEYEDWKVALNKAGLAATEATGPDTCRAIEVDGETVHVRGTGEMTEQERAYFAEVIRAAKRKFEAEHPEPASSPLRNQIATAIRALNEGGTLVDLDEEADVLAVADAVLTVILPTTRLLGALHRSAHEDVNRVIDLYGRWVKAGPPPLGTSMSRWWDARLAELHAAILPPDQPGTNPTKDNPVNQQEQAERRADIADDVTTKTKALMTRRTETLRKRAEDAEQERDGAYRERAHLVALLAAMTDGAVITYAPDVDEPGWQIVYLTLGGRQASWHISPRDAELFRHVERVEHDDPRGHWDGHTTEEKYEGIAAWTAELAGRN